MVSKELQNKFYAALESLKDGKNDYILEALAAGAKATFENFGYTGTLRADAPDQPVEKQDAELSTNWHTVPSDNGAKRTKVPDQGDSTDEDSLAIVNIHDTDETDEPVDLVDHFDDRSGNRFPAYTGQFTEEPDYTMVAEAINKLGKTIGNMKTKDNAHLVEAIQNGYSVCFK